MPVGRPDLLQEGITCWYKYLQEKTNSGNRAEKGKQVLADGTRFLVVNFSVFTSPLELMVPQTLDEGVQCQRHH